MSSSIECTSHCMTQVHHPRYHAKGPRVYCTAPSLHPKRLLFTPLCAQRTLDCLVLIASMKSRTTCEHLRKCNDDSLCTSARPFSDKDERKRELHVRRYGCIVYVEMTLSDSGIWAYITIFDAERWRDNKSRHFSGALLWCASIRGRGAARIGGWSAKCWFIIFEGCNWSLLCSSWLS